MLASYTIAKLIDNTNSEINWLEAASPSWGDANAYNLRASAAWMASMSRSGWSSAAFWICPLDTARSLPIDVNGADRQVDRRVGRQHHHHFPERLPDYRRWLPGCAEQLRYSQRRLCTADENSPVAPRLPVPKTRNSLKWYDTSVFTAGDSERLRLWHRFAYRAEHTCRRTKEL